MYSDFVSVKLHFGAQRNGPFFRLGPWKAEMQLQQKLEDDSTCMTRMLIPVKYEVPVEKKTYSCKMILQEASYILSALHTSNIAGGERSSSVIKSTLV